MGSLRGMARANALRAPPAWLKLLLANVFFEVCPVHPDASRATRSGGCNLFCTTCTERPLCSGCIAGKHDGHTVIQVRKSSNHNCVKLRDIESLLGAGEVQPYLHNGELVVFLNKRTEGRKRKGGEYRCIGKNCDWALLHKDYRFCSLGCKLECMKADLDISFAVTKDDSESSKDGTKSAVICVIPPHAKRRRGWRKMEDGAAGTSATPSEPPAGTGKC